jgi:hypothetical protein
MRVINIPNIPDILEDQSSSYWLKESLKTALERDPIDAANDVEILMFALVQRADEHLEGNK